MGHSGKQAIPMTNLSYVLILRQRDNERCPLPLGAPGSNAPAMSLHYFLANGKTHACSFIFAALAVEPMEGGENLVEILLLKTDAVILHNDLTS